MQSGHVGVSLTPEELSSAPEELSTAPELEELLLDESSFFAQEMTVRPRRNMEKIMSIYPNWFKTGGFRETEIFQNLV